METANFGPGIACACGCLPGDVAEGELNCGLPQDTTNGGCNLTTPLYSPIACGQAVCGTIASPSGAGTDDDWFTLSLDAPTRVSWSLTTDSDLLTGFVETDPPGSPDCADTTGLLHPSALVAPTGCDGPLPTVLSACLGPGEHRFRVAVSESEYGTIPCGSWYRAVLECGPVLVGDLDCDGLLLPEWGSVWQECLLGPGQPIAEPACQEVDLDDDEDVDLGDVARFGLARACTPGAPGCGWRDGDLVTYNQESWGGDPTQSTAAALVLAQFNSRYPGGVEVGLPLGSGFSMFFSSGQAILGYQPASGATGSLNADLVDPTSSASGEFGGHVLALQLDLDFADSGHISGTSGLGFGDLRLCNLTATPAYNGLTVRQFLLEMNTALGGGAIAYAYDTISPLTNEVSSAFEAGLVSRFAQDHLFNGACPCTPGAQGCGWEDGHIITHTQVGWGDPSSVPGILLNNRYDFVYAGTGGLLEIGIAGAAGFSILFTSASAILTYEPAQGAIGPLNADLVDPTSSASGAFGGEILALQLNVDFSDSGDTLGSSGLQFGDLTVCNFTSLTALNGTSVRSFLSMANTALGGGATSYPIADLFTVAEQLNAAFEGGLPSPFAQKHLFNGACPCTPGAPGCGWTFGDVITHTQLDWGEPISSAGILLNDQFNFVYASSGLLEAGLSGAGFSMFFTSAGALLAYQPASGNLGPLNSDLLDPLTTPSGAFGGEVVAVILNTDFAAAGHTLGTSGLFFGDLTLCAFTSNPALNGISVNDFLAMLNSALGGGPAPYTITVLHLIAEQVNAAFSGGSPSVFAQEHLFNGACPCTPGAPGCGWEDGDVITYTQNQWGEASTIAGQLLVNFFDAVYFTAGGVLEVGGAFTMTFQAATAVLNYQPSSGTPAPLNANLVDPTSSASGQFGGEVVALKLNIDFGDADHISGAANVPFGNLTLCSFTSPYESLNGTSVRSFLATANVALGGGATTIPIADLNWLAIQLNASFESGSVLPFSQQHLFNGACP
jgi:hypothetical protein